MSKQLVAFVLFWGFTLFRIPVPAVGDILSGTRCTAQDSPLRNELRTTTTCSDHGAAVSFTTVSNTQETSVDYVCTLESGETITGSPWTQQASDHNVPFTVSVAEQLQPGTNCTFYVCYWYFVSSTAVFGRESPASCITDTDECATNNGGCEFNCVNTIGSFHCSCPTGYIMDEDGLNCNDTNECTTNNGGCEQKCNNTIGSFYCSCRTGYLLDGNGFNCSDINECENGDDNCNEKANCTNITCNLGYAGDGVICTNINGIECNTDNGGCEHNCTDTIGSFNCSCDVGYTLDGNGFNCSDINECENGDDNCNENANCTNTEGSFTCSCNPGYAGDGDNCTNINECNTDNGGCEHNCTDTIGSFNCSCDVGYLLDENGMNCSGEFPSEATVTVVISVGIIALLIAAMCVVFCAAHHFRKDSTMFTSKVYLSEVLDPEYSPVSPDTVPKLSTLPSMSSVFDTLCNTVNTQISDTGTSSTSEIKATHETLDTVLDDNSTKAADVASDTGHVNFQMPQDTVGASHDTLLMTETGISSTSYFKEEREESCSTSGLEENTQTDGEELVICGSNSPDACAVSHSSANCLSSGDTTGIATVKQSSDYIISEDLLVGSHRPLSTFDLDDHVSESELPPSVGLETGFHDQKSLTFSNEETENQEYFQTTKFQSHPGYLPNTHLLSSAKRNVDSFGGQNPKQSASSGRDGLRTDMKSPPNPFPLLPHHCRTPSESSLDCFNDIMHNQLDASSLSKMQHLSASSGYIIECSGSRARENGQTLP